VSKNQIRIGFVKNTCLWCLSSILKDSICCCDKLYSDLFKVECSRCNSSYCPCIGWIHSFVFSGIRRSSGLYFCRKRL